MGVGGFYTVELSEFSRADDGARSMTIASGDCALICQLPMRRRILVTSALLVAAGWAVVLAAGQRSAAALQIVVIAGEGAVNIVQQKTAIAPVVEVRDRNDQPVAGAVIR